MPQTAIALRSMHAGTDSISDVMPHAAAATAVLINGLGDPLGGAVWWALRPAWNQSRFDPKIVSQGCVSTTCSSSGQLQGPC